MLSDFKKKVMKTNIILDQAKLNIMMKEFNDIRMELVLNILHNS